MLLGAVGSGSRQRGSSAGGGWRVAGGSGVAEIKEQGEGQEVLLVAGGKRRGRRKEQHEGQ